MIVGIFIKLMLKQTLKAFFGKSYSLYGTGLNEKKKLGFSISFIISKLFFCSRFSFRLNDTTFSMQLCYVSL